MFFSGIGAALDAAHVFLGGVEDLGGDIAEHFNEFRGTLAIAEDIMDDDDVAIAAGAGAAANDGDIHLLGNGGTYFVGHGFKQEHGGAAFGQEDGVGDDAVGLTRGAALGSVAALLGGALGEEAEVGADG